VTPYQKNLYLHKHFRSLNEQRALERAKANVERYFPVVGILEELNATLALLENRLPYFFRGVQEIYFQDLMGMVSYSLVQIDETG
jgi:hypothetical protein